MFSLWRKCVAPFRSAQSTSRCVRKRTRAPLTVELLEDRTVPTTYTVTNNADSGLGSLRQAILNANKHIGADRIVFNMPSSFLTVSLVSALPTITDPVTIDGTTQKGSTGAPNPVTIDGTLAGTLASGFIIATKNTTIKGLIVQDFAIDGIWIQGPKGNNNTIVKDQIRLNGQVGIAITDGANNLIGGANNGNVITQNGGDGVWITGRRARGNRVVDNLIGTDSSGAALGNGTNGVEIGQGASNNRVRGNEIVANGGTGVYIHDAGTNNNRVRANFIGATAGGSSEDGLGNHSQGVDIALGASNNVVTGGNVIGNNLGTGVYLHDPGTTGNTISGNCIGTDSTGTVDLGNGLQGVDIRNGANGNMIGGRTASAGNMIAFNHDYGVLVIDSNKDAILSNNIFANWTRGIGEFGTGNNGQPAPVLNSASVAAGTTTITGNLGPANTSVLFQLFKKGANGQEVLVFSGFVKTDAKGNFSLQLTGLVSGDDLIATATVGNNTSVFSQDILVQ